MFGLYSKLWLFLSLDSLWLQSCSLREDALVILSLARCIISPKHRVAVHMDSPPGLCSCLDCGSLLLKQFIQLSVSAGPSVFVWRLCHSLCGCHPVSCLSSRPPQGNLSLSSSSLRNPLFPVFKLRQTSLVAIKLLWIVVFLKCPLHIGIFIFYFLLCG